MTGDRTRIERGLAAWAALCRRVLRLLVTERDRVPAIERVLRGVLLVPVFGVMLVPLRLAALAGRTVGVETTTRFGARLACGLPDLIQTWLYHFGVWEPDITRWMQRRLAPGDTVIDVGANIGYHALLAADAVGQDGRVVAIEASPVIHALLLAHLATNDATQVRSVNAAASDAAGTLEIHAGPGHNIGRTTTVGGLGFRATGSVEAAPLDALLTADEIASARLVKIDVEGAEDRVLAGMGAFLDACPDDVEILVELSPAWWPDETLTPRAVLAPLLERGFRAYAIPNDLWPWRYLWPNAVEPPRPLAIDLDRRVKRIDLVLSRCEAPSL